MAMGLMLFAGFNYWLVTCPLRFPKLDGVRAGF